MENRVLAFMDRIHSIEEKFNFFEFQNGDGVYYWDIVRHKIIEILFYKYTVEENVDRINRDSLLPKLGIFKKGFKFIRWVYWLIMNEINFFVSRKPKRWLFLKISRFYDEDRKRPYDAVADEIFEVLKKEAIAIETFKTPQTDIIRLGHQYQTFHLFIFKKIYRKLFFKKNKTYQISTILKTTFPNSEMEAWDELIQNIILDYKAEFIFGRRIFKRFRPEAIYFTGGAKGYTHAAKSLNIRVIEIQHSPLNRADVFYSYNPRINYKHISTLPDLLLVNSDLWKEQIYYPPLFYKVGSDYFYNSSKQSEDPIIKDTILFVSDPQNHFLIRKLIMNFIMENELNGRKIIFKLHSSEADWYEEAKEIFKERINVSVVLNERNISSLLDEALATFLVYSSVAYQAIQKGNIVFLIKTGYYEGGYDIFDNPNVHLVELDQSLEINTILKQSNISINSMFFEPLDKERLIYLSENLIKIII